MFVSPPTHFPTERLVLRKPKLEDANALFDAYASDPKITHFMSWIAHTKARDTEAFLETCIAAWNNRTNFEFVIERHAAPGIPMGMTGMHPKPHSVGFGYVIAEKFWNNGLTSEALSALVQWSLEQEEIFRAQAFCDVENLASARVMEKAGMTFLGVLKRYFVHPNISDVPRDCRMYAKTD